MPIDDATKAILKKAFDAANKDGNDTLNLDEFGKMIRNELKSNASIDDILQMFTDCQIVNDKSGSEEMTFDEVIDALNRPPATSEGSKDKLVQLFKKWDTDGSGKISEAEVKSIYNSMGLKHADAAKAIEKVDKDGDGMVNLDEFVKMMEG